MLRLKDQKGAFSLQTGLNRLLMVRITPQDLFVHSPTGKNIHRKDEGQENKADIDALRNSY